MSRIFRNWWPLAAILVLTIAAVQWVPVWVLGWHDALYTVPILWAGLWIAVGWLALGTTLPPLARVWVTIGAVALSAIVTLSLSLDGYTGDRLLRFSWRWRTVTPDVVPDPVDSSTEEYDIGRRTGDWLGFRGPDGLGALSNVRLETDWEQHPPELLWEQDVGPGWSPFVTTGELCITQEQRGDDEAVVAYRLTTGERLWEHRYAARFHDPMGGTGPRSSPVLHNDCVVTLGATGELRCLSTATGKLRWRVHVLIDCRALQPRFGFSSSPLIVGNCVVVPVGGRGKSLAAYDLTTGERRWAVGETPATYSSPMLVTLDGRELILVFSNEGLFAHAPPATGAIEWRFDWPCPEETDNITQPLPITRPGAADRILISTGYGVGSALLEMRDDHSGVNELWRSRGLKAKFTALAVHNGYVYGLDENILVCIDLADGSRMWKAGRYGYGQMLLVDDVLLIQAESGDVVLVATDPEEHRELARLKALDDRAWSHPVLAQHQYLLVRNDRRAACYRLKLRE